MDPLKLLADLLPPRPPPSSSSSSSRPRKPATSPGMTPIPLSSSKKAMQEVLVRHCLTPVARTPLRKAHSYLVRAALDLGVCAGPASAAPADLPCPVVWSRSAEFARWLRAMVECQRVFDVAAFRHAGLRILPEQKVHPQDAVGKSASSPLLPTPPQPSKRPLETQNHAEQPAKKAASSSLLPTPPQPAKKAAGVADAPQQHQGHQGSVRHATLPAERSTTGTSTGMSSPNHVKRRQAIVQLLRDAVQKLGARDTQAVDKLLKEAMTLLAAQNALDNGKDQVLQRSLEKISARLQELKRDQNDLKVKQAVHQPRTETPGTAETSTPSHSKEAAKSGAAVSSKVMDATTKSTSTSTSTQTSASSTPPRPRTSISTQTSPSTPPPLPLKSASTQTALATPPSPVTTSVSTQTSPCTPPPPPVTSISATPRLPVTSISTQTSSSAPPVPAASISTQTSPSRSAPPLTWASTAVSTQTLLSISTHPEEIEDELPCMSVGELVIRAVNLAMAITDDMQSEAQLQEVLASAKQFIAI